jgi:hypothetical protein
VAAIVYPAWDPALPDGVYLGLPHARYFGQETRGSSDWTDLHRLKHGWWWKSRYNRHRRRPKSTAEQTYGSNLHVLILEGLRAYEEQCIIEPAKADFPEFDPADHKSIADTIDEMRAALLDEGLNVPPKSRHDREGWAALMLEHLPRQPCWCNIMAEFSAEAGDRQRVSASDDFEMRFLREMALSEDRNDNEQVRRLLVETAEHPPLVEVSVFATIDGIRRRWRFDRMFPAATMDLKSLGPWSGRPLHLEAGEILARRRWSIQRADYDIGRRAAYGLVEAGKVHGGTLEQQRYLERIVADEPKWDWIWLIYQKPDSAKGTAPILMPVWDDWNSPLAQSGAAKLESSIRYYKGQVAAWGLHEPWGRVEPLHYATGGIGREGLPSLLIPNYEFDRVDDPDEAEAYERAE